MSTCFVCGVSSFLKILGSFGFISCCLPCVILYLALSSMCFLPDLRDLKTCHVAEFLLQSLSSWCCSASQPGQALGPFPHTYIDFIAHSHLPSQMTSPAAQKGRRLMERNSEQKLALVNCFFL